MPLGWRWTGRRSVIVMSVSDGGAGGVSAEAPMRPRTGTTPVALKTRTAHHFLQAPDDYSIEAAVRWGRLPLLAVGWDWPKLSGKRGSPSVSTKKPWQGRCFNGSSPTRQSVSITWDPWSSTSPIRGCPRRSGKSVATPARLWYQSGVKKGGEATDERTVQNRGPHVHAEQPGAGRLAGEGPTVC